MHYGAYILFSGRGAGVVTWLRPTIHASSQNSDALPTATLFRCCWFVVCVLSRCLRLAFCAFCCSHPLGSFANLLVGFVLSPSWGSLLCCSPPSACVYGGAWWVGCLRVVCWFVLCVVEGAVSLWCFWGCFLCVFLLGLLLGRGKEGECKGVSFGFSRGCSNRVFDGVLSVFEGACTGGLVACLGVGSEDKGDGVSLGCSNWDF